MGIVFSYGSDPSIIYVFGTSDFGFHGYMWYAFNLDYLFKSLLINICTKLFCFNHLFQYLLSLLSSSSSSGLELQGRFK